MATTPILLRDEGEGDIMSPYYTITDMRKTF